jgi:hypothetical protein
VCADEWGNTLPYCLCDASGVKVTPFTDKARALGLGFTKCRRPGHVTGYFLRKAARASEAAQSLEAQKC